MKNRMAPSTSLAIVLVAAAATVALRAAARRPEPQWMPGTEPAPVTVTDDESRPLAAVTAGTQTAPTMKWPGRRVLRVGHPVLSSRCSMYFTSCTPMGATVFAQSARAGTG